MAVKGQKIGLDANCPIVTAGPNAGALAPTVADPDLVAGTGAGWVRINFVRGPWSAPDDATEFEGRDWVGTYRAIIDGFKSRGLKIYGLIGHDIMPAKANSKIGWLFRLPAAQMFPDDVTEANRWIDQYAHYFGQVVQHFWGDLECVESFNEPDDWHASNRNWIHPEWFARMLQQIYHQVRDELGISQVQLISGPLQGLEINNNGAADYMRRTYQEGKRLFGWGQAARFPFDGVGYHLYLQRDPTSWAAHEQALRRRYREYIQGMMRTIDDAEGPATSKKLYMSEVGWESNDATPEDDDFQARNLDLLLSLTTDDPAVAVAIWFCTQDFTIEGGIPQFYGLYRPDGLSPQNYKPAYQAFKALCEAQPVSGDEFACTNQQIINAFYDAAGQVGQDGWDWLQSAGLAHLIHARSEKYSGPAIDLLKLTADQKARIKAKLPKQAPPKPIKKTFTGLAGKGMYMWMLDRCEGGNPQAIVAKAQWAGLSHVLIKIADGTGAFNIVPGRGDMVGPVVTALRSAGIQVWGWQYVYGYVDAEGQAQAAIRRIREFDLDGFVVNAEGEWEGYPSEAANYMKTLRAELPQFPVALSSFRFPSYHQSFPWKEFLAGCDLDMPQVYWQNHPPVADLEQALQEHATLQNARPVFPTGAAYFMEANVPATPEQVHAFLTTAKAKGLSGANFWSWQHANGLQSDFGFNIWQTIADFDWS